MKQDIAYYFRTAASMSPDELLRKASGKLMQIPIEGWKRMKVLLGPKAISDQGLQAALSCPLELLLSRLDGCDGPCFFVDPRDRERFLAVVAREFPSSRAQTVKRADEICDHHFELLGSGKVGLGPKIDWHRDFKSGHRWKPRYYRNLRIMDLRDQSDIKVPWELSRFQHLVPLGKAYWYTGNERYAREFGDQVMDWIAENPPMVGVNWANAMEVAIRAVNWIWGHAFFKDSPTLTRDFKVQFLKALLSHGRFIAYNLEYHEIRQAGKPLRLNSNHYLSDLVGLVYLGIMFPEFTEAKGWLQKGLRELFTEMGHQVHPDGVDYEASISYHRLVTELFTSTFLLCQKNGLDVPSEGWERLERMFEFILHYTKPNGRAPQIGDADDGRLHPLSDIPFDDHRYLLSIGAALFGRPDLKAAAGSFHEEAIWLLGPKGSEQFQAIREDNTAVSSRAFPQGGFYIMRHQDHYLICDTGGVGIHGHGSHGHNDTLSFELYAFDKAIIVDPGAFIYSGNPSWRNRFRSTAYHNTVVVDGHEMNRVDEGVLFWLGNEAEGDVLEWESTPDYDVLDAQHRGYERLNRPVIHRRRIFFDKNQGFFILRDTLSGTSDHKLEWPFHFDSGIELKEAGDLTFHTRCEQGANLVLKAFDTELSWVILDGWVSTQYGVKNPAKILHFSGSYPLPKTLTFLLYPYRTFDSTAFQTIEELVKRGAMP